LGIRVVEVVGDAGVVGDLGIRVVEGVGDAGVVGDLGVVEPGAWGGQRFWEGGIGGRRGESGCGGIRNVEWQSGTERGIGMWGNQEYREAIRDAVYC